MNTTEPMTREQLDEIKTRADSVATLRRARGLPALRLSDDVSILLAEVERLRALTTVDDDMVERVTRSLAAHWHDWHTNEALGRQRALASVAVDAVFGSKGDA